MKNHKCDLCTINKDNTLWMYVNSIGIKPRRVCNECIQTLIKCDELSEEQYEQIKTPEYQLLVEVMINCKNTLESITKTSSND
jgi:hypothetical protein